MKVCVSACDSDGQILGEQDVWTNPVNGVAACETRPKASVSRAGIVSQLVVYVPALDFAFGLPMVSSPFSVRIGDTIWFAMPDGVLYRISEC